MASEYGCTPAEIMHCTDMHPMDQFQFNSDVFTATSLYEQQVREQQRSRAGSDPGSAGVATTREKQTLVERQNQRAEQRDQGQPDAAEQVQALEEIRSERDSARGVDPDPTGSGAATEPDAGSGMDSLGDVM